MVAPTPFTAPTPGLYEGDTFGHATVPQTPGMSGEQYGVPDAEGTIILNESFYSSN